MTDQETALLALKHLHVSRADDYEQWIKVGMILKRTGCTIGDWETWSRQSAKYVEGDCARKWNGFNDASSQIATVGTLVAWAKQDDPAFKPPKRHNQSTGRPLDWNEEITQAPSISTPPAEWDGVADLITYLSTLFKPDEFVSYVFDARKTEKGKYCPVSKGIFNKTAAQLINDLRTANEIPMAMGDYDEDAGGWVRANPVDGKGVSNDNVTDCRYCLVESDELPMERQLAIIRRLQLPCAAILHSGGKSIHAIVKIEAGNDRDLYRDRVEYLFGVLEKEGFIVDRACKNPARLSRLPGLKRGSDNQRLIDTNCGQPSWAAWDAFSKQPVTAMPIPISVSQWIQEEPEKPDQILQDTFDVGDKLCLIAPPKARKSFFFLQMLTAIASGEDFLAWHVIKPRNVLLVQFEVRSHHYHRRTISMCKSLKLSPASLADRFYIINARGWDIDRIYEAVARHVQDHKTNIIAFDPLYKMHQGDENSAEDLKPLLLKFDQMAESSGASICFIHHDAKGASSERNIRDRGAGSNVIGRDVDCKITMTPHAREEAVTVIEIMGRNYPPQQPIKCEWKNGKFEWTGSIDPRELEPVKQGRKPEAETSVYVDKAMEINNEQVRQVSVLTDRLKSSFNVGKDKARAIIGLLQDKRLIKPYVTKGFPRCVYVGRPGPIAEFRKQYENPTLEA